MLDGVHRSSQGEPVFQEAHAPSVAELQGLLKRVTQRILKLLTRTGYLIEERDMRYLAEAESDRALTPLQAAACTYRSALTATRRAKSAEPANRPQPRGRFHAAGLRQRARLRVDTRGCAVAPMKRKELERLCRYVTRPAIANERLKRNPAGQVVLQLKTPYRDGTTRIVMSALAVHAALSGTGAASRGCI